MKDQKQSGKLFQTASTTLQKTSKILSKNSSKNKKAATRNGWSQDEIPLAEVKDGICCMKDNTYVKIIEVEATDYKQNRIHLFDK